MEMLGLKEGRINSLRYRKYSVAGFVAPADTPGKDTYIASQTAGADGGAAPRGGDIIWQPGAGAGAGRAGIFEVQGQGKFTLGITFGGAELIVGASNVLHLGASGGTPDRATNSGDVYVKQILEVDGISNFNGALTTITTINCGGDLKIAAGQHFMWNGVNCGFSQRSTGGQTDSFFFLPGDTDKCWVNTLYANRIVDHDHGAQIHPSHFLHSALSPTTDHSEYSLWRYNGLNPDAWTMETDRATFDFTIRAVSALPGASTNKDGGSLIFQPGANETGGTGTDGVVILKDADGTAVFQVVTGFVKFGTKTGTGDVAVDGHVTIKDSAGNMVKLATVA